MLRKNPLKPSRPFAPAPEAAGDGLAVRSGVFLEADDFDSTGILTGVDPSASGYWWLPELYGPEAGGGFDSAGVAQATIRTGSRAAAAA